MSLIYGFRLEKETTLPEARSGARVYRHEKTGARLLCLENEDENKVFSVTFRTPPSDSTGLPHILEHSVLCGSRRYPVKEPFVELLKGSLQTFLNAFTFPDKTCYPVASTHEQDLLNLMDVYLDAVFHPRLTPQVLEQEGWHYELEDEKGPMTFKGVVYNEMKGAYSSPDGVLSEKSQQAVFPDTTYGLDSGGDPEVIPELTFEDFQDFHSRLYHPSNAWFYLYGDGDFGPRMQKIDEFLSEFETRDVDSTVALQPAIGAIRRLEHSYAADEDEPGGEGGMITVNWLLPPTTDGALNLRLQILEHILVGLPSSPLRQALIDSGLGEDLAGVGLESDLRQMYFSVGLRGMDPKNADRAEALVVGELERIAAGTLDPDVVEAALNTVEFDLRENNTGRFPRGLALMLRSLTTWLYDADPLLLLRFEDDLAELKQAVASGERVFEDLVARLLVENPHRATVVLTPDPKLGAQREKRETERLAADFAAMDEPARKAVVANTASLRRRQEAPDDPELLARIPRLTVADLDREQPRLPLERDELAGSELLFHDLPTSSIVYLDLVLDLDRVDQALLPLVPLFGRALEEMGTRGEDFIQFTRRIARKTGGVDTTALTGTRSDSGEAVNRFVVRSKATLDKTSDLLAILSDLLTDTDFTDRERFRKMVLEEKARLEHRIVPAGHMLVAQRLAARFSPAAGASERMGGVTNLQYVRDLTRRVDKDWDGVLADLEAIRTALVDRGSLLVNLTLDRPDFEAIRTELETFVAGLPAREAQGSPAGTCDLPAAEGLTIPAQVNYVGKGVSLREHGIGFHGSQLVVNRFLRTAWFWDRVRVQGGAYGCFSMLDRLSGVLSCVSYRDPNVDRTLEVYDATADFLEGLDIVPEELEKAVIGAVGDLDSYMLPDAKGYTSMARHLQGIDDQELQSIRDEVLATGPEHFRDFAACFRALRDAGQVVVLGSRATISKAKHAGKLTMTRVL